MRVMPRKTREKIAAAEKEASDIHTKLSMEASSLYVKLQKRAQEMERTATSQVDAERAGAQRAIESVETEMKKEAHYASKVRQAVESAQEDAAREKQRLHDQYLVRMDTV